MKKLHRNRLTTTKPMRQMLDILPTPRTQAERVINKFGGPRLLAAVLKAIKKPRDPATIYRWTYPKDRFGRNGGGRIPTKALDDVLEAAKYEGIILTSEDLDPRSLVDKKERFNK